MLYHMCILKLKAPLLDGGINMQICYIPSTTCAINFNLSETIENAVSGALDNAIVKPFQNWCYGIWCWTVDASLPVCTTVSLISLMLYMIGVKKARKWIIIPIMIYIFIQLVNGMI